MAVESSDLIYEPERSLEYEDSTELDEEALSDETIDEETQHDIPDPLLAEHIMQKIAAPPVPEERAPTRLDRGSFRPFADEDTDEDQGKDPVEKDTIDLGDPVVPPIERAVPKTSPMHVMPRRSSLWPIAIVMVLAATAAAVITWAVLNGVLRPL